MRAASPEQMQSGHDQTRLGRPRCFDFLPAQVLSSVGPGSVETASMAHIGRPAVTSSPSLLKLAIPVASTRDAHI